MNPKLILSLFISASVGLLLPTKTEAAVSAQPESVRQSSIKIDVADLDRRESSELLLAENTSSNSSSNTSSNESSNSSSNSSSNQSSDSSDDDDDDDLWKKLLGL